MRRTALRGAVVVMAGSLLVVTASRVHVWSGSDRGIWAEAVAHSPDKPRPWINLGRQYALDGADRLAAEAFTHALALSGQWSRVSERPMRGHDVARLNLALLRAKHGRYDEALTLTAPIQPRAEGRHSIVNVLEAQWRDERQHGPSQGF